MTSRTCRVTLAALLIFVLALPVLAQSLQDQCDRYLTAAAKVRHFQGTALLARGDQILFARGYGMADVEKKVKNTPETVFLLGSVTKQFTATAIMQLVEQGKISLDSPITAYLPDYPRATGSRITIHHLLTHTSGIPSYTDGLAGSDRRFRPVTKDSVVALVKDQPLQFEPGSQWRYDNSGYFLLGLIVEKVSGEPYGAYMQKHIFDPLKMTHSGCADLTSLPAKMAGAYSLDSTRKVVPARMTDMSWPFAAGSLYSTVGDMLLWDRGIARHTVLSAASYARMTTPFLNNYGYGISIDTFYGRYCEAHDGSIDGFMSIFERYPNDSLCVVVLANNDAVSVETPALALAAIALGKPYDLPVKKAPVALDSTSLSQYVGVFEISPGQYRAISQRGDTLFSQRTGSEERRLLAESRDKFYYDFDNALTLTFLRDSAGVVARHRIHQAGADIDAQRIIGPVADSVLQSLHVVTVDPAVLALYAGVYSLTPGFTLTVTVTDGRIFAQGTGQPKVELHPRTSETFFVREVGAEVSFIRGPDGRSNGLILTQYGQTLPARRIK